MRAAFILMLIITAVPGQTADGPEVVFVQTGPFRTRELRREAEGEFRLLERGEGRAADVADAVYRIDSWVRGQGYPDVTVTAQMISLTPHGELIVETAGEFASVNEIRITVDPGERVFLGTIAFDGVSHFAEEDLRAYFPRGRRVPYVEQRIRSGVEQIARLYELDGFVRREVGPHESERVERDDRIHADVTISVREGPRFVIREVRVDSEDLGPEDVERLKDALDLVGEPYYPRQAVSGALVLRRMLGRDGYDAAVSRDVSLDEEGNATVVYHIDPGPVHLIDDIVVRSPGDRGLRTRDQFIRSLLRLDEGDIVDFAELDRFRSELYSLGLYGFVDVGLRPVEPPRDPQPGTVYVEVEERDSRHLDIEAGWGAYELLRGSVSYTDRNVFGLGRRSTTTVHGSFRTFGAELSVSDRIIFGPASTVTLSGRYSYRDGVALDETAAGVDLSISYAFTREWNLAAGYSFEWSRAYNLDVETEGADESTVLKSRVGLAAEYDTRDSVLNPTAGGRLSVSPAVSFPLASEIRTVVELDTAGQYHIGLAPNTVLSLSGKYRVRYLPATEAMLAIQDRLFLGGPASVRSFGSDELGLPSRRGVPRGGLSSLQGTAELRFRVQERLSPALFYDIGFLSADSFSLQGDWGYGLGAGVRYNLPVGPLRLDVAYNPADRYAADRSWAVHFAVGLSY